MVVVVVVVGVEELNEELNASADGCAPIRRNMQAGLFSSHDVHSLAPVMLLVVVVSAVVGSTIDQDAASNSGCRATLHSNISSNLPLEVAVVVAAVDDLARCSSILDVFHTTW